MTNQVLSRKVSPKTQVRYVSERLVRETYLAVDYLIKVGPYPPTLSEISQKSGYPTGSTWWAVEELTKRGLIGRTPGKSRSIQVLKPFPRNGNK